MRALALSTLVLIAAGCPSASVPADNPDAVVTVRDAAAAAGDAGAAIFADAAPARADAAPAAEDDAAAAEDDAATPVFADAAPGFADASALPSRGPSVGVTDRTGTYFYAGDAVTHTVSQHRINVDGTLSPLATATIAFPLPFFPTSMNVSRAPGAHTLYVGASDNTNGALYQLDIAADGQLSYLAQASPASLPQPIELVIDPNGLFLFAVDHNEGIRAFTIAADGALSANGADTTDGHQLFSGAITPDAAHAYFPAAQGGGIEAFTIGADGRLTRGAAAPGFGTAMAMHPSGNYLYLSTSTGLARYTFDAVTGAPTHAGTDIAAISSSQSVIIAPDGLHLYATGQTMSVAQYAIAADGSLTPLSPATVPSNGATSDIVMSPDGRFLYVPNAASGSISQYRINADGTLAPLVPPYVRG